jgi:DNA-binding XRE family transcriptional regulator
LETLSSVFMSVGVLPEPPGFTHNPRKGDWMQHGTPAVDSAETQTPERREPTRGQRVRIARIERGWTQRELAVKAGLLERTVSLVEQDHTTLRDKTIFKLSRALDLSVEDLLVRPCQRGRTGLTTGTDT